MELSKDVPEGRIAMGCRDVEVAYYHGDFVVDGVAGNGRSTEGEERDGSLSSRVAYIS